MQKSVPVPTSQYLHGVHLGTIGVGLVFFLPLSPQSTSSTIVRDFNLLTTARVEPTQAKTSVGRKHDVCILPGYPTVKCSQTGLR